MKILLSLRREIPTDVNRYDGVGLLKCEHVDLKLDVYDRKQLNETRDYIQIICKMFNPKPVWYRTNDASTTFMNQLGSSHQHGEKNPHFGLRGVRRSLVYPESLQDEIKMIQSIRKTYPNLNILFPFINDVRQYVDASKIARAVGYDGRIGIMAELPSAILTLDDFISAGVDYIVFGINDLSDCMDGCSRKNTDTANLIYRDHQLRAIQKLLDIVSWRQTVEYILSGDLNLATVSLLKKYGFNGVAIPYYQIGEKNEYNHQDIEKIREVK